MEWSHCQGLSPSSATTRPCDWANCLTFLSLIFLLSGVRRLVAPGSEARIKGAHARPALRMVLNVRSAGRRCRFFPAAGPSQRQAMRHGPSPPQAASFACSADTVPCWGRSHASHRGPGAVGSTCLREPAGWAEGRVCTWARTFGRAGSALITGFASSVTSVSSAAVGVVIPTLGFLEIKS